MTDDPQLAHELTARLDALARLTADETSSRPLFPELSRRCYGPHHADLAPGEGPLTRQRVHGSCRSLGPRRCDGVRQLLTVSLEEAARPLILTLADLGAEVSVLRRPDKELGLLARQPGHGAYVGQVRSLEDGLIGALERLARRLRPSPSVPRAPGAGKVVDALTGTVHFLANRDQALGYYDLEGRWVSQGAVLPALALCGHLFSEPRDRAETSQRQPCARCFDLKVTLERIPDYE